MNQTRTIENERLRITVKDTGAELCSIYDKKEKREIIWQADPAYWKRHAPVLFPNVGKTYPGNVRYGGKTYPTSQHGFARDKEFSCVKNDNTEIIHQLTADSDTQKVYPFSFRLSVLHHLEDNRLTVRWLVENADGKTMYFTIGGHPAFQVPAENCRESTEQKDYYLTFSEDKEKITYILLEPESGTALAETEYTLELEKGRCPVGTGRFDQDALIFDHGQIEQAGIAFPDGTPYVTLSCEGFPNFGIWQAPGAPFICLEPWWGRCDNHGFDGTVDEKPGIIAIKQGETFEAVYTILVGE